MENNEKSQRVIDPRKIMDAIIAKKKTFFKVWAVVFVLSCLIIFPAPRYYTSSISVSPESADALGGGSLASIASSFGLNMGSSASDAIYPQLYPDLFGSTQFLVDVMDVQVTTSDGEISTDYFTYLQKHRQRHFIAVPFLALQREIKKLFAKPADSVPGVDGRRFNPFHLSRPDNGIFLLATDLIKCSYSRTTDVVTITVEDQDALVCATMADSVSAILQKFITEYRTSKARREWEHYASLVKESRNKYDSLCTEYSNYVNTHRNLQLEQYKIESEKLNNEVSLEYQIYSTLIAQMQAADAKVQDRTPVFTTLTNATVPVKPAGPKRMIFVIAMLFLSTCIVVGWLFRKELVSWV